MGMRQGAELSVNEHRKSNKQQSLRVGVGWQVNLPEGQISTDQRSERHKGWEWRQEQQANLPKPGRWWIPQLVLWNRGQYSKLNCPTLLGEEPTKQTCSYRATQLPPGENNSSEHPAWTGSEVPQLPIATYPVDRMNQILLTSQSPGETTSELPLVHQYLIGCQRNNSRTFTKQTELLVVEIPGVFIYFSLFSLLYY
jgi:hypothetical protein